MFRPAPIVVAILAVTALAFAPVTTAEEGGPTADVTIDTAEVVDGSLDLSGAFAFGGALVMGEDAAGDATGPAGGLDLATVTLEQTGRRLRAELRLHDPTPTIGTPEVTRYGIPLKSSSIASDAELHVWTSAAWQASTPNPHTSIDYTSAANEFTSTPVEGGALEDGTGFYWDVSLSEAGLTVTDTMDYPTASTMTGIAGFGKLNGGASVHDTYQGFELFSLAGDIELQVLDADGEVVVQDLAVVAADGTFSSSIDVSELAPGEYQVVASGAYANVSDTETLTITIE